MEYNNFKYWKNLIEKNNFLEFAKEDDVNKCNALAFVFSSSPCIGGCGPFTAGEWR